MACSTVLAAVIRGTPCPDLQGQRFAVCRRDTLMACSPGVIMWGSWAGSKSVPVEAHRREAVSPFPVDTVNEARAIPNSRADCR